MSLSLEELLLEAYAEESRDLLADLLQAVSHLDHREGQDWHETILRMRRDMHTLKGSAGAVGLSDVADICHALEDMLLDSPRPGSLSATKIDEMQGLLSALAEAGGKVTPDVTEALARTLRATPVAPIAVADVDLEIEPRASGDGDRAAPTHADLDERGGAQASAIRADGSLADWVRTSDLGQRRPAGVLDNAGRSAAAGPVTAQTGVGDADSPPPSPPTSPQSPTGVVSGGSARQAVRIDAGRLEALHSEVADLTIENLRMHDLSAMATQLNADMARLAKLSVAPRGSVVRGLIGGVERDVFQLTARLRKLAQQSSLALEQIDDTIRDLSMAPLNPWLQTFSTAVRTAARSAARDVKFEAEATSVELGRAVLAKLREPMLHLLRNAIAHGIEPAADRVAMGKSRHGTIRCVGHRDGDRIRIEVSDDGRGVDRAALAQQAQRDAAVQLDGEVSLLDLMCLVGVSTAKTAGNLAGRGVGMSAVSQSVTELGGTLEVTTTVGQGTTFIIHVPVRISRAQGIIVTAAGHTLALPMLAVQRVFRLEAGAAIFVGGVRCVELSGGSVPLFDIMTLIAAGAGRSLDTTGRPVTLLLHAGGRRVAVLVDDVLRDLPLVTKPLGAQFADVRTFSGCAVSPDGTLIPVLEVPVLIDRASAMTPKPGRAPVDETSYKRPVVLVVDDALTMRTLQRNLLVGAGYEVHTATDGQDGWEMFCRLEHIDVVVSDVQMPRMDGFALCEHIRASGRAEVPVILVTSLGGDKDRERGAAAGADGYIVKGDFEAESFLGVINRFAGPIAGETVA